MGHAEIVEELLKRNLKDTEREDGATGLFKATQKGNEAIVKLLLDKNPNLNLLKVNFRTKRMIVLTNKTVLESEFF